MNDASSVRRRQGRASLICDVEHLRQGQASNIRQALLQRHALQELHGNVGRTIGSPSGVEDINDVGVANSAGGARFVEKSANQLCILRESGMENLDGGATLN